MTAMTSLAKGAMLSSTAVAEDPTREMASSWKKYQTIYIYVSALFRQSRNRKSWTIPHKQVLKQVLTLIIIWILSALATKLKLKKAFAQNSRILCSNSKNWNMVRNMSPVLARRNSLVKDQISRINSDIIEKSTRNSQDQTKSKELAKNRQTTV